MKYFIITVDTEGDNLWSYSKGDPIKTNNTDYIPRFQALCESIGFKPVYLTNYEMLSNDEYVQFVKLKELEGQCEVGMHLHAWNNPPLYELKKKYGGNPFLIEYPDSIMQAKFKCLYDLFIAKLGHAPFSHRAGRWAMDDRYFKILEHYDIKVDCSVTPHIDWSKAMGETRGGTNYKNSQSTPNMIGSILEVPLTVYPTRMISSKHIKTIIKSLLKGRNLQLRPALFSLTEMKKVIDKNLQDSSVDYVEFMIHSSELMPNGSPYFPSELSIELMYRDIQSLFQYAFDNGYRGITLKEYYNRYVSSRQ